MSLSVDYSGSPSAPPESLREGVLKFLTKQGAEFVNILSSDPDEALYKKLKLASVPAVLVYDQKGDLRKRFDNEKGEYGAQGFSYEKHIVPLVEELLAK